MKYYTIPPSPKLAPYVRTFWVYEGTTSIENSSRPKVYYPGKVDGVNLHAE